MEIGRVLKTLSWSAVFTATVVPFGVDVVQAQQSQAPGGFIDSATGAGLRPRLSAGEIQTFLPQRGSFTFPTPYGTTGARLTNASDCGGGDCVNHVGYSYWRNINNHVGSDSMLVVLGLDRQRGGAGPSLFSYNKQTGETRNTGPLFSPDSAYSWASGEGWYFSASQRNALYMNDGVRLLKYDVVTHAMETVFDIREQLGGDRRIWQTHSSNDDRVHSATVKDGGYNDIGCAAYNQDTGRTTFIARKGDFDECQIDKSGRWLLLKENVDGRNGEDNRIIDLQTGAEQIFYDEEGAAGHSDLGYGYLVAEDNFFNRPGAVRVWQLGQDVKAAGQGTLVYGLASWDGGGVGHLSHANATADTPSAQQAVCSSNAYRENLPRVNEIVCYRLDGSMNTLIVAPNMTDLNASGGGSDDYSKRPKGNLDPTGEYFVWTSNAGTSRNDAFIVRVPLHKLAGGGSAAPGPAPSPTPAPTPVPAPAPPTSLPPGPTPAPVLAPPTTTPAEARWMSLINVTASGTTLEKTGGCSGCPDASAVSEGQINGSGSMSFAVTDSGPLRFVGLGSGGIGTGPADINFAIRLQSGVAEVRESGAYTTETGFSAGDTLQILVEGGVVAYLKNGAVFHTSARQAGYALRAHAILFDMNATIGSVLLGGVPVPTSGAAPSPTSPSVPPSPAGDTRWISLINVTATGATLHKTGGCSGCPDATAVSEDQIDNNGSLAFVVADPGSLRFIGLGSGGIGTGAADINFGIRLQSGVAEVRESGAYKGETAFAAGDRLQVTVDGGAVAYSKNGTVFYTSTNQARFPLRAHAVLFDTGATLDNVAMR